MTSFIEVNCLKATEPLRGDSVPFTTQFSGFPGTHLTSLRCMKGSVNLGVTQWFWHWYSWIENLVPLPVGYCSIYVTWWWWIFFVLWLTDERRLALFLAGPLSVILNISNLWHATSRIWACAEPQFRLCWMRSCSSDNHYTTAAQKDLKT